MDVKDRGAGHTLQSLLEEIVAFRDERDWQRFHTPRNLATALSVEVAELQEALLWKTDAEVDELVDTPEGREAVRDEIADVLIYGLLLCDALALDPTKVIRAKLEKNEIKYPAELARGRSTKYTHLE